MDVRWQYRDNYDRREQIRARCYKLARDAKTGHADRRRGQCLDVTPFVTTCFLAALQTIPVDLLDAAKVDGTSAWQNFIYITLPILKPILVIIILLRGIWMFNKFDVIWLLTKGGPLGATEHLPILTYQKVFQTYDIGGGTAVATISFLFLVIVVSIYLKVLVTED